MTKLTTYNWKSATELTQLFFFFFYRKFTQFFNLEMTSTVIIVTATRILEHIIMEIPIEGFKSNDHSHFSAFGI